MFNYQYEPSLKPKQKGNNGGDKAHNMEDVIKLLDIIRSIVCGVEAHLQGTWSRMKAYKYLYT